MAQAAKPHRLDWLLALCAILATIAALYSCAVAQSANDRAEAANAIAQDANTLTRQAIEDSNERTDRSIELSERSLALAEREAELAGPKLELAAVRFLLRTEEGYNVEEIPSNADPDRVELWFGLLNEGRMDASQVFYSWQTQQMHGGAGYTGVPPERPNHRDITVGPTQSTSAFIPLTEIWCWLEAKGDASTSVAVYVGWPGRYVASELVELPALDADREALTCPAYLTDEQ